MLRVLLDSNAFDAIALDEEHLLAVENASSERRLEFLVTHVQIDEVSRTPDDQKRRRLLRIAHEANAPTAGAVWGLSKWDMA